MTKPTRLLACFLILFVACKTMVFPSVAVASGSLADTFSALPKKNSIVDCETFNAFTSSSNNVTNITFSAADYQIPIKFSRSGESGNIHVKSISGASGADGDYGVELCYPQKSSLNGTYVSFYINGKDGSTSAIKNDRIIFELDVMLAQSDAEVQLRKFLGESYNLSLFNSDGTVGSNQNATYSPNEWKHLLLDLNFPDRLVTIYYDNTIVEQFELTAAQTKIGTGVVQFNLINNNSDSASFAFDNLTAYTIVPLSESIGYVVNSAEYTALNNSVIPTSAQQLIIPLTGCFKDAKNVVANVSLTKNGVALNGATLSYTTTTDSDTKFTYGLIKITLPDGVAAGDYAIEYGAGLIMIQTVGTSTTTEYTLATSYTQPLKIVETNKIALVKNADGSCYSELYYDSETAGEVTMIIAAYNLSVNKPVLSSLKYESFDVTAGLNELSVTHSDVVADCAKAMIWSDIDSLITPLLESVTEY